MSAEFSPAQITITSGFPEPFCRETNMRNALIAFLVLFVAGCERGAVNRGTDSANRNAPANPDADGSQAPAPNQPAR